VSHSSPPGAHHSVIRGDLNKISETSTQIGLGPGFCVVSRTDDVMTQGRDTPSAGQGLFYLVEYFDGVAVSISLGYLSMKTFGSNNTSTPCLMSYL
jgi:hypothetical protein